jgi:NTP pyrophosphatase (non-canonical NTP hydrolase)
MNFNEYQLEAEKTAIYDKEYRVIYPATLLSEEAGEVSGKIAKMLRDNKGEMTEEYRKALIKEMGDCLWALAALATDLNVNLGLVASLNIAKLKDRKEREVIQGEGDDR